MADLFVLALLGHLVGDFMLQPKHTALHKSTPGWSGFVTCTLHVAVYTAIICLLWGTWSPVVAGLVFIPHWVIDRWSLASLWLKLIKGRTFEVAFASKDQFREFDIAFTCIVYTVVDATLHLLCLLIVIKFAIL